jgi:hypothetical protein
LAEKLVRVDFLSFSKEWVSLLKKGHHQPNSIPATDSVAGE